jgi:hypothetical protein
MSMTMSMSMNMNMNMSMSMNMSMNMNMNMSLLCYVMLCYVTFVMMYAMHHHVVVSLQYSECSQ